jgi:anti-sigma factor RsiW
VRCEDIDRFVLAYVDGEFEDEERVHLERHIAGCPRCREVVSFHTLFKTHLRARLRRPEPPATLRANVLASLDRADAAGEGPRGKLLLRLAPGLAMATAAAVILFGVMTPGKASVPLLEECARAHEKNLPVEVGGTEEDIHNWMVGKVSVPVRPPRFQNMALVGGRMWHVQSRDAAQLTYRVAARRTTTTLTIILFDPQGSGLDDLDDGDLRSGEFRGTNVVLTRRGGVGYAFVSELAKDDLLHLVRSVGE